MPILEGRVGTSPLRADVEHAESSCPHRCETHAANRAGMPPPGMILLCFAIISGIRRASAKRSTKASSTAPSSTRTLIIAPSKSIRLWARIPVSEHLFAWRTTTTARLTDDAEAMGNDLHPVLCTVGLATAHRRPYAIQLLGRLFPRIIGVASYFEPTFRTSRANYWP